MHRGAVYRGQCAAPQRERCKSAKKARSPGASASPRGRPEVSQGPVRTRPKAPRRGFGFGVFFLFVFFRDFCFAVVFFSAGQAGFQQK